MENNNINEVSEAVEVISVDSGLTNEFLSELVKRAKLNFSMRQSPNYHVMEFDTLNIKTEFNARVGRFKTEAEFVSYIWNHITTMYLSDKLATLLLES